LEQEIPYPRRSWLLLTSTPLPLVLDLDGTLILTDTSHQMMLRLLIKKPWLLCHVPFWFIKGRAFAKARLTDYIDLSPQHLPYNVELLTFAKNEAQKGRPLILATGSDQRIAQKIADHLGIFQEVIGSDGHINMTGPRKQRALLKRFGIQGFDYAGDSRNDLYVWKVARKALVVHPKRGVLKRVLILKGEKHTHRIP
jgi:haloacid dehalogenase-like hydrolase